MLVLNVVSDLCGIDPQVLRNRIAAGTLAPAHRGLIRRGKGHRFSMQQAVGICVATELWRSEQGCASSYFSKIVTAFEAMTESELRLAFEKGFTHFLTVTESGRV